MTNDKIAKRQIKLDTKIKEISDDFTSMKESLEGKGRVNSGMIKGVQEDINEMKKALRDQVKVMKEIALKLPEGDGRASLNTI